MVRKALHLFSVSALLFLLAVTSLGAENGNEQELERFGPYVALERNEEIVRDVRVETSGRIYLRLDPAYKEREIRLKNSVDLGAGYRRWFNGELELVSEANQGKAPDAYTDWVETTANYVEYYMDGELILHLAKESAYFPSSETK